MIRAKLHRHSSVGFIHLPIGSQVYVIDDREWELKLATITGINLWPRSGFQYEFGRYNRQQTSLVYATVDEALGALAKIVERSPLPVILDPSKLVVSTMKQYSTEKEESSKRFSEMMPRMSGD